MKWEKTFTQNEKQLAEQGFLNKPLPSVPLYPEISLKLQETKQLAPWLTPETQIALAKANASANTINAVGRMAGASWVDKQDAKIQQGETGGLVNFVFDSIGTVKRAVENTYDFLVPNVLEKSLSFTLGGAANLANPFTDVGKQTARAVFALADIVPEAIQNTAAVIAGSSNGNLGDFWRSTSIATLLENWDQQGEGFLISQKLRDEQARRAREFRGTIHGTAFTLGRGAASLLFRENSLWYKGMSGLIDASVQLASPDPTKYLAKGLKFGAEAGKLGIIAGSLDEGIAAAKGKGLVPLISAADIESAVKFEKATKKSLMAEAGVTHDITGPTVNYQQWDNFMRSNPLAQRLVKGLVEADDPLQILDTTFRYAISNDMAIALSKAKSQDEVLQALRDGWSLGEGALDAAIGKYKVNRVPLFDTIRKSRWLTEMPTNSIVVSGDRFDNVNSVKNMVLSMRTSGVSEDFIKQWSKGAITAFSESVGASASARSATFDSYKNAVAQVMKQNGVVDPIIQQVMKGGGSRIDSLRSYFRGRAGIETDNGLAQVYTQALKDVYPPELINDMLDGVRYTGQDMEFLQPMQLSELLNRVQVMPDVREIRRLTRNPMFAKLMPKGEEGQQLLKKMAITSSKKRVTVTQVIKGKEDDFAETMRKIKDLELKRPGTKDLDALNEEIDNLRDAADAMQEQVVKRVITGKQRVILEAAETFQNVIWKPLNLATLGYIIRNGMDAQVRMAFSGLDSAPKHPLDYINLLMGNKYKKSLTDEDIVGKNLDQWATGLRENFSNNAVAPGFTDVDMYRHGRKTGSFAKVSRTSGGVKYPQQLHTDGIIQEGQKILADPLRSVAAQGIASGKTREEVVEDLIAVVSDTRSQAYRTLEGLYGGNFGFIDPVSQKSIQAPLLFNEIRKKNKEVYERVIRAHMDKVVYDSVSFHTGNIPELQFMYAYDAVGDFKNLSTVKAKDVIWEGKPFKRGGVTGMDVRLERMKNGDKVSIMVGDQKIDGVAYRITGSGEDADITFVPFLERNSMTGGANKRGTRTARRQVDKSPTWDGEKGLPEVVTREQFMYEDESGKFLPETLSLLDNGTNWFFNRLYERTSRFLEKSPVYRQFYYRTVGQNVNMLSPAEAQKFLDEMGSKAAEEGVDIRTYLGLKDYQLFGNFKKELFNKDDLISKIENIAKSTTHKGTATISELDDYAKFRAIADTKELLYDASTRNNLEDSLRVIAPFVTAWREILGTYTKFLTSDTVYTARRFQRIYSGLEEADPEGDGRGFFYKDPQTNQTMFTFPLSGNLARALTGIYAPLEAPVSRLSQGISVYPALGPYAQLAASALIPDTPKYDKINELLLPYGTKSLASTINPTPGWVSKMAEALPYIGQKENKLDSTYANTYIETLRALSVNPKYNLSTEEGIVQLQADAKSRASILTGMRALSQFVGPTAGTTEYLVPTDQGDQYVSTLIQELKQMQAKDYDSAIDKFLNLYGDEMVLYVSSKSRAVSEGLEATREFGVWERDNRDIVAEYSRIGNYFAPTGSDFLFSVWQRQLNEESREKLTAVEMIKLAQLRVGSTKYRAARRMFGSYPNEQQRKALSNYRVYLNSILPGFPVKAEFVTNQYENDMIELRNAVEDSRLANNELTPALKEYLDSRDAAIIANGGLSLKSKKAAPYRAQLYQLGEDLAASNPTFARIWQRLIAQEVED